MAGQGGEMSRVVPAAARWLGAAGLAPFFATALAVCLLPAHRELALALLVGYGAIILSFMGGCRWGFAAAGLGDGPTVLPLAVSVVPALWAWPVAMAPALWACLGLAAGFAALLAADIALAREGGAPPWWPTLRWPLTLGAVASLGAGAVASV